MDAYSLYTDDQLVTLLREGDDIAFTEIYNRYWKLLFYVACKRLNTVYDAEEVVQDVFADIWARRESIQISRSLKYYLSAAAQYQVMNRLAKKKRRFFPDRQENAEVPADHYLLFKELEIQIQELVEALPERCKLVYHLSRREGMNNKQIASHLTIAEKTVENQLTKAIARIKHGLGLTSYICILLQLHNTFDPFTYF